MTVRLVLPAFQFALRSVWLWLACWGVGYAQPLRIEHLGVEDGLTQGSVNCLLKDSRGFLWLGTQDGLNRYDSHQFRAYRPSLADSGTLRGRNIFGIVETPDGNLWVGTEAGLNRYERQNDRFTQSVLPAGRTLPFWADRHTLLYLNDHEGLVAYDYQQQRRHVLDKTVRLPATYDFASSTVRTSAGDVWLHAPSGLLQYTLNQHRLRAYFSDRPDNVAGPPTTIYAFCADADGVLWLGTANGLIRFDPYTATYQTYDRWQGTERAVGPVLSIAEDHRGQLWLGTEQSGLLRFDKRARLFEQVQSPLYPTSLLSAHKISKIFVDDQDIVWANTDPDGLVKIVQSTFMFGSISRRSSGSTPSLSSYSIRAMLETPEGVWVATDAGINVVNPRTNQVLKQYMPGPPAAKGRVKCLFRDSAGRIWAGAVGGLYLFNATTSQFTLMPLPTRELGGTPGNYVRNVVELAADMLLAATEDGLYLFDVARQQWQLIPALAGRNIFSLYYDAPQRFLWVGTYLNGFYGFQLPANPKQPWRLRQRGLPSALVLHWSPDPVRGCLWAATDRGLAQIKLTAGIERALPVQLYTTRQGLANAFVYSILPDREHLWFSTNHGLSRLDPASGRVKNFDLSDGLQGYEFNGNAFLRLSNGELWFGGVNGLNRFWPGDYRTSMMNPKVHLFNLLINEVPYTEQNVDEVRSVQLAPTDNTLSIEFSSLDYLGSGRSLYQYRLVGYDKGWITAGQRNYARYPNLPPGDYQFQVRAANKDGNWSTHVRELGILIATPFWRRVPFIVLVVLALSLGVIGWVNLREGRIRQQQEERLRLAFDIQEQVKRDIARDLHDEIGTRLATLKLYAGRLAFFAGDDAEPRSLKDAMFGLVNDTISDVRNLLRKLNPRTLEQYGYVAALEELLDRINATGSVHAHLIVELADGYEQPPRLPAGTELMLYRITQELVGNTLKHAGASNIDIHLRFTDTRLVVEYQDNGAGFDMERTRRGRGLGIGNIESRVEMLSGQIVWQTDQQRGTRVAIQVPFARTARSWTAALPKTPNFTGQRTDERNR